MRVLSPALLIAAVASVLLAGAQPAAAARVKDVAQLAGVRVNQLQGYGIVTGLDGTGDSARSTFTVQSVAAMLSRSGVKVAPEMLRTKNVAAVMVTAILPPFATPGSTLDVTVSSLGDAKSLRGGSLMLTPLLGVDGKIYAMASGELSVGGYSASGGGSSVSKNHATAGRIPSGATIEQPVGIDLTGLTELVWVLHDADFTTARNMADAITKAGVAASARDGRHVVIPVGEDRRADIVGLIAAVE
jgi:flagellar P-ring protein precursor FlgI